MATKEIDFGTQVFENYSFFLPYGLENQILYLNRSDPNSLICHELQRQLCDEKVQEKFLDQVAHLFKKPTIEMLQALNLKILELPTNGHKPFSDEHFRFVWMTQLFPRITKIQDVFERTLLLPFIQTQAMDSARKIVQSKRDALKAHLLTHLPQVTAPPGLLEAARQANPLCKVAIDLTMGPNFIWTQDVHQPIKVETLEMLPPQSSNPKHLQFALCERGEASFSDLLAQMDRKEAIYVNCTDYLLLVALKAGLLSGKELQNHDRNAKRKERAFLVEELKKYPQLPRKDALAKIHRSYEQFRETAHLPFLHAAQPVKQLSDLSPGEIVIFHDKMIPHPGEYFHMALALGDGYVISHWCFPLDHQTGAYGQGAKVLPIEELIRICGVDSGLPMERIGIKSASDLTSNFDSYIKKG